MDNVLEMQFMFTNFLPHLIWNSYYSVAFFCFDWSYTKPENIILQTILPHRTRYACHINLWVYYVVNNFIFIFFFKMKI
jgi:hypothetical protein